MRYLLALALLTIASVASAQWQFIDSLRLGGFSSITALAADSSGHILVYSNGLFVYDTATHTWSKRALPETTRPLFAVLPTGRIIAGFDQAVYYSDDGCATWNTLGHGFEVYGLSGILWNDTAIVAVGSGATTGMMVLGRSDSTWRPTAATLPISNFTFASRTHDGFFVASFGRRLYRTRDPLHWDPNDSAQTDPKYTKTIVLDNGDILALAQFSSSVYRSQDWGATWSHPLNLSGLSALRNLFALKNGQGVASTSSQGFYLTNDYGATWQNVLSVPVMVPNQIVTLPNDALIVGSTSGLYRSNDSGASWRELDSGWSPTTATALGAIGDTVFVSVMLRGSYRSHAMPPSWIPSNDSLTSGLNRCQVAHGTLYGASSPHLVRWNGSSWSALPNLFEDAPPVTYTISTSGRVFAATATQFFYLTSDNQWRTVTQLFGLIVKQTIADSAGRVYALVGRDSIFYSTDNGENWSELPGRPTGVTVGTMVAEADTLALGTTGGSSNALYMTDDLGAHWSTTPYSLSGIYGIAAFQGRFFVYNSSTLLERESREASWTASGGIPSNPGIIDLSISPNGRGYVLTTKGLYARDLPSVPRSVLADARSQSEFTVYPNPASHAATVMCADRFDIIDAAGRRVASLSGSSVDCSSLLPGVYTLRSKRGAMTKLVVIR